MRDNNPPPPPPSCPSPHRCSLLTTLPPTPYASLPILPLLMRTQTDQQSISLLDQSKWPSLINAYSYWLRQIRQIRHKWAPPYSANPIILPHNGQDTSEIGRKWSELHKFNFASRLSKCRKTWFWSDFFQFLTVRTRVAHFRRVIFHMAKFADLKIPEPVAQKRN